MSRRSTSAGALDDADAAGGLAERADHLLVVGVADEHDVVAVVAVAAGLVVHLGHQRAGGVDHEQVAVVGVRGARRA